MTSGCWPGKPHDPFPAEKTTTIPSATAPATAAASAWLAALSGGSGTFEPQLFVMMCGPSAAAALNAAVTLTSAPDAEAVFTGSSVAPGAAAKRSEEHTSELQSR